MHESNGTDGFHLMYRVQKCLDQSVCFIYFWKNKGYKAIVTVVYKQGHLVLGF